VNPICDSTFNLALWSLFDSSSRAGADAPLVWNVSQQSLSSNQDALVGKGSAGPLLGIGDGVHESAKSGSDLSQLRYQAEPYLLPVGSSGEALGGPCEV